MTDPFRYLQGVLHAEGAPVPELAAQFGTPLYVYARTRLEANYRRLAAALSDADPLIAFAVKANGALAVLQCFAKLGAGADIVSAGELDRAQRAGVAADKIVFSGVGKTAMEIDAALGAGIRQFNIESPAELELIAARAEASGRMANAVLRINPDVAAGGHAHISTGKAGDKFGVALEDAPALFARARDLPSVRLEGLATHIGSQIFDLTPFMAAFDKLRTLSAALRSAGNTIRTIDVGGGVGAPYEGETALDLNAYGQAVARLKRDLDVDITCEPGRFLTADAGLLATRVTYVKQAAGRRLLIVDAGMNDLARPALYGARHPALPVRDPDGADRAPYDIVGPVCETTDRFAQQEMLPELVAGDLLAFTFAGAYGATLASEYNARPRVAEAMVADDKVSLIRRRPTYAEMAAFDSVPDWV